MHRKLLCNWKKNPVPTYIMSCYAYEVLDSSFITDAEFDKLGAYISEWYDCINHRHKHFIDEEGCAYTSALTVPYHELPLIILNATHQVLGTDFKTSPIYEKAMLHAKMKEFI